MPPKKKTTKRATKTPIKKRAKRIPKTIAPENKRNSLQALKKAVVNQKANSAKPRKGNNRKPANNRPPNATPNASKGRTRTGGKLAIDYGKVEALRQCGCTDAQIAAVCEISEDTITRRKKDDPRFAAAYKKGFEHGTASLRMMQFTVAMKGCKTMLIWLGKQYLGQSDKQDLTHKGDKDAPVAYTDLTPEKAKQVASEVFPEYADRWARMGMFGDENENGRQN